MSKNYSDKNLQGISFLDEDLAHANFSGSDLRGTNFTGSNLSGADFTHVKTGISSANTVILFFAALVVSLISGYVAMLAGQTVQGMLKSNDSNVRTAAIVAIIVVILFIVYAYWKGVGNAIKHLIIPATIIALVTGMLAYFSRLGTGQGMLYVILYYLLVVIMFIIGTFARAAAGTLSNILFLVVALSGGMFGRSIGGGIGTVIMAIACMQISKRALGGAPGFEVLRKMASLITRKLGTSFRNTRLADADFSGIKKIKNCDFTGANTQTTNWGESQKINCLDGQQIITEKSKKHKEVIQ
ncbi:MAG TPA: pentapeptide repeat-containing protein [Chitinophagaceae bacterium]|nr:pentapeptide repeat-containing protein [Chitinophagaceae bacterium]